MDLPANSARPHSSLLSCEYAGFFDARRCRCSFCLLFIRGKLRPQLLRLAGIRKRVETNRVKVVVASAKAAFQDSGKTCRLKVSAGGI
jgi:hypothetical protein